MDKNTEKHKISPFGNNARGNFAFACFVEGFTRGMQRVPFSFAMVFPSEKVSGKGEFRP